MAAPVVAKLAQRLWVQRGLAILAIVLASSLAGCSAVVNPIQGDATASKTVPLQHGATVGQTFTAYQAGLTGIDVFLRPKVPGDGLLRLHLRSDPQSSTDLAVATLSAATITRSAFYRFTFPPLSDSRQHDYYALIEYAGTGSVEVGRFAGDTYLDGALYLNGQPIDAQLTFRLVFEGWQMLRSSAWQAIGWGWMLLVGVLLFVLPGWALLALLWPDASTLAWAGRLGLSAGVSLALYPLLLLWTDVISVHAGVFYAGVPLAGALGVLGWRSRTWHPRTMGGAVRAWAGAVWPDVALLLVVVLTFVVRFSVISSLDVPMWGDSYHHTLIAQLLVDNGGLFNSWQPYAEIQSLTYHFGFHTASALVQWLTGLAAPQATLWSGQLLNGLACLALYPLAARLGGNRWAGVGAVLLAGLLTPMPNGYTNWGRYTQLAGQAILPASVYLAWEALHATRPLPAGPWSLRLIQRPGCFVDWRLVALTVITFAGLALTHYRILLFAACFFAAFFVVEAIHGRMRAFLAITSLLALGTVVLFLPWGVRLFASKLADLLAYRVTTPASAVPESTRTYNAIGNLTTYLPAFVWVLLALAIGWGLWRRDRSATLISLWWGLVLLAANPQWFHLPGEGLLSNFAVFIAAYIPASVLIGAAAGWLIGALQREPGTGSRELKATPLLDAIRQPRLLAPLLCLLIGVASMWGAIQRMGDLRTGDSALVTRPDLAAAGWIRANTPPDARFLVNSFFAYGGSSITGSDGGWWLPLLAGRQTTLPPITYSTERGPRPDYRLWVNNLRASIEEKGIEHPDVLKLLREHGVSYVYIGQRQGRVNYQGRNVLNPEKLRDSEHFRPVYHQSRVWVFEVSG